MKHFCIFLGFILLSAFSFAGYAQQSDIPTGLVKFRYFHPYSDEFYLSKTTQFGDNAFKVAEGAAAGFYIDKAGESYLILSGAPDISGDYVKGEYTYLYASKSLGFETVDGFNESNGYLQSKDIRNALLLLSVQAVRKGNTLYVLGDVPVTDYSKLDQLAQAGTVKKIDLAQISNFEYKFGSDASSPNLPDGCYYIESEIGAKWGVDDYSGLIKAQEAVSEYSKSYFYVEGENNGNNSNYLDFNDGHVRINLVAQSEYLCADAVSYGSYNEKGITFLGSLNKGQYGDYTTPAGYRMWNSTVFELKKESVPRDKIYYSLYAADASSYSMHHGGYLTTVEGLGNDQEYYIRGYSRLIFLENKGNNSLFSFRKVEDGSDDFFMEAYSGGYIAMYNGVPVIVEGDYELPRFSLEPCQVTGSGGEPAGKDGTGHIDISLEIPSDVLFSGSFRVTLPGGMSIDINATKLADGLVNGLVLTVTQNVDGSWLFKIEPHVLSLLKSASSYQQIVDIAYNVDESVADGRYEVKINDVDLIFEDGTAIFEPEIIVPITVDHSYTGSEPVMSSPNAVAVINGVLYVDSPAAETVSIYSATGRLLYHAGKPAGEVRIPLSGIDRQVVIIRGSSGWVEKVVRH